MESGKWFKTSLYVLLLMMPMASMLVFSGAAYLLSYALKPEKISRNDQEAWARVYKNYPDVKTWHDSLVAVGALRDTVVSLPDFKYKMRAWYVRAPRPTANTALLLHGYTDCGISIMPIARMYHRDMGMNVLVPDLSNSGQTGNDHYEMGVVEHQEAIMWAHVAPRLFGDSVRIVAHGVSMGAATAMLLAGEGWKVRNIIAYVEDCGYSSLQKQYVKELRERFNLPSTPLIPVASWMCKKNYGFSFSEVSPVERLRNAPMPMLFIHGTADTYVPTKMVYEVYKAKREGEKQIWLVPGAGHARSFQKAPEAYADHVRRFLQANHFSDEFYWIVNNPYREYHAPGHHEVRWKR